MSEPKPISLVEFMHHDDLQEGEYEFFLPAGEKLNLVQTRTSVDGPAIVRVTVKRVYDFNITMLAK